MFNYEQIKTIPISWLTKQINSFLQEDIPIIDYTSQGTIPKGKRVKAYIESQQELVFAGKCVIEAIFPHTEFDTSIHYEDGDTVPQNENIVTIEGDAQKMLEYERTVLNILQRLCGIATVTAKYVEAANRKIDILDTRKTLPGFRLLDKYAVSCGGGRNHRLNLSAGVMIKDNHISAAGGIRKAVDNIKNMDLSIPIEVEIDNLEQLKELVDLNGIDAFLLDNMPPKVVREVTDYLDSIPMPKGGRPFLEASGGITLENIPEFAETDIDAVSIGALTHSVKAADMHMEILL